METKPLTERVCLALLIQSLVSWLPLPFGTLAILRKGNVGCHVPHNKGIKLPDTFGSVFPPVLAVIMKCPASSISAMYDFARQGCPRFMRSRFSVMMPTPAGNSAMTFRNRGVAPSLTLTPLSKYSASTFTPSRSANARFRRSWRDRLSPSDCLSLEYLPQMIARFLCFSLSSGQDTPSLANVNYGWAGTGQDCRDAGAVCPGCAWA